MDFAQIARTRIAAAGLQAFWQKHDAVREDCCTRDNGSLTEDTRWRVCFQPGYEPAALGVETCPPSKIVVSKVKNVRDTGLNGQRFGGGYIIDACRRDSEVHWCRGVGIVHDCSFVPLLAAPYEAHVSLSDDNGMCVEPISMIASRVSRRKPR